eukprot:scaffold1371_cov400-Prasinococcus_capsulatus_cf.AAC.6
MSTFCKGGAGSCASLHVLQGHVSCVHSTYIGRALLCGVVVLQFAITGSFEHVGPCPLQARR